MSAEYNLLTIIYLSVITAGNLIVIFVCIFKRKSDNKH